MIEDKASIRVQKICGVQENVHRKELTLDLGEQGELVELVVFRGKRINYCTSKVRSVFILRKESELSKFDIGLSERAFDRRPPHEGSSTVLGRDCDEVVAS
jgi:hypothetical protein